MLFGFHMIPCNKKEAGRGCGSWVRQQFLRKLPKHFWRHGRQIPSLASDPPLSGSWPVIGDWKTGEPKKEDFVLELWKKKTPNQIAPNCRKTNRNPETNAQEGLKTPPTCQRHGLAKAQAARPKSFGPRCDAMLSVSVKRKHPWVGNSFPCGAEPTREFEGRRVAAICRCRRSLRQFVDFLRLESIR